LCSPGACSALAMPTWSLRWPCSPLSATLGFLPKLALMLWS
jgi:hypothetical protein